MSYQVTQGQVLSPPYPFTTGTLDVQQTQILERLKQLRLWQKQQQGCVLKQQQLKLQGRQDITTSNNGFNLPKTTKQRKEIVQQMVGALVNNNGSSSPPLVGNLQPKGHTVSGSSLHSTDSGMLTGQSSAVDVKDKLASNEEDHTDSSGIPTPESHGFSDNEDGAVQITKPLDIPHDEIPVNPGIGPGSASTFEELLERKLQLYEANPSVSTHFPHCPSEESFVIRGKERQQTEEAELQEFELLENAAQDVSFSSQCSLVTRVLSKDIVSSSPKASNITKRNLVKPYNTNEQRLMSLSPVDEVPPDQLLQPHTTCQQSNYRGDVFHSLSNCQTNPQSYSHTLSQSYSQTHPQSNSQTHPQSNSQTHPQSNSQTHPQSNSQTHPQSNSQTHPQSNFQIHPQSNSQTHPHSQSHSQINSRLPVTSLPSLEEDEEFEEELDSTLKQNQTKFDDEEEWESFMEEQLPNLESDNGDNVMVDEQVIRNIPVRKVRILSEAVITRESVPLINPSKVIPKNEETSQPTSRPLNIKTQSNETGDTCTSLSPALQSHAHITTNPSPRVNIGSRGDRPYNPDLPPPSALVAKLFPSLRKEREIHKSKYIQALQLPNATVPKPESITVQSSNPLPPTSGSTVSSDIDTLDLSDKVKEKLIELENEIRRFKKENMALDNLRRERETLLSKLKDEVVDFEKARDEQLKEFEQYKMEEIKKLKKERKIFESFQREANAVKDRKMKDDLISLNQELEELQEEMRSKELRWSSSLSRYRIRIDSLEAQNNELQNDLKVVEEQRLLWWQQQLEAKRSPSSLPKKARHLSTMPNSSFASEGGGGIKEPSPLKGGYHKQRRKSDPPLKNRGLGKENKHPNPNKPHNSSPSLNVSNKMDNAKKVVSGKNVPLRPGIKSAVHQNRTKSLQTVIKPREAHVKQAFPMLDSNDDDVSDSAFGNRSDECEVIEIRGCEYKKGEDDTSSSNGDLSDQAESIVSKILEQPESERTSITTGEANTLTKSVRFLNISYSSSSSEGPSPEPHSKHDSELHSRLHSVPNNGLLHSKHDSEPHSLLDNGPHSLLDNDAALHHNELQSSNNNPIEHKHSDIDESLGDHSSSKHEEHVKDDGTRVILFPNGTKKILSSDGLSSTVYFFNGDIKRIQSDGTVVYVYSQCRTTHRTFSDGKEIVEFSNGQTETRSPSGEKMVEFPDGTIRHIYPNGEERVIFANGTVQYIHTNGDKTIQFTDGQKEIHTKKFKQREYPDGTIKTVYPDGRQETKYSNGRLRIKDKDGHVLMDNNIAFSSTNSKII